MIKEIIATIATFCIVISYLPQIIKGHKTKSLEDISWGFLFIINIGVILWVIYGILNEDTIFIVANIILVALQLILICMKYHYGKK